jgi:hypothetical protein
MLGAPNAFTCVPALIAGYWLKNSGIGATGETPKAPVPNPLGNAAAAA